MSRILRFKEGLHDRREQAEHKAHGAQRARHNNELGEGASTAQRSDPYAQQVVQTFLKSSVSKDHFVYGCFNGFPARY